MIKQDRLVFTKVQYLVHPMTQWMGKINQSVNSLIDKVNNFFFSFNRLNRLV